MATRTWREWLLPVVVLSSNWMSATGVVLVTASTLFWLAVMASSANPHSSHPYIGIVLWVLLPAVFLFGLILIPAGMWLQRRKAARTGAPHAPVRIDLTDQKTRRVVTFVVLMTLANAVIASSFGYSTVSYMDSTAFCGLTCHKVMTPEFTAYQNSPHSRVDCVQCHIGPGASWFVKSKISGARQLFAVAFETYQKPIQSPIPDLRPSRDICEACHWPQKFSGERLRVINKFAEDEANTKTQSVLMMHIGGPMTRGIHGAHVGAGIEISYGHSDRERQQITWVKAVRRDGTVAEYTKSGQKAELGNENTRVMDCIDCHNRPTHTFELAERGVDRILTSGEAVGDLPFVKKKGVELLKGNYATREEALKRIPVMFEQFYQQSYPEVYVERRADIQRSATALAGVYGRNVFPEMKITWGTYINNIGHTDAVGCFRCHDDEHKTKAGKTVSQDCSVCHEILAMDESKPKIVSDLGLQ